MTTKWAHLPNAEHIDRIIESIKTHPKIWAKSWVTGLDKAWDAAAEAAWDTAMEVAWNAARYAAVEVARYAAWLEAREAREVAWDATLALVAYDECAYLLDCEPDELRLLSKLGDHRATLLLPACIAFKEINALQGASFVV